MHSSGFKLTNPPNPSWTYGQRVDATSEGREWREGEKAGWKSIDTSVEEIPREAYTLLSTGIIPRPIAFVSSISREGVTNLAPFSGQEILTNRTDPKISSSPPVISVSCVTQLHTNPPSPKNTASNIKATKGFTVNIISIPWVMQANIASVDAPEEFNEWLITGLTQEPSIHVEAPRVKESAFSMECELLQAVDVEFPSTGEVATTVLLGLIKYIHVRKDVLDENGDRVDAGKLKAAAMLGSNVYAETNKGYIIQQPFWKDHEKAIIEFCVEEQKA